MLHVIQSLEKPNICFTKICKLGSFSVIQSLRLFGVAFFFFIEEKFFQELPPVISDAFSQPLI